MTGVGNIGFARRRTSGREIGKMIEGFMKNKPLVIPTSNVTLLPTVGPPAIDGDDPETVCTIAGWQRAILSGLNMESSYIDDEASTDPGLEIPNSIMTTASEGCVEFNWLESTRIPIVVFGDGEGVPPESFIYGLDDSSYGSPFCWEYDHALAAWTPLPLGLIVMPVEGEPLKIKFATFVPDANAVAYPRGFRIDPVEVGLGWTINLVQIMSGLEPGGS